MKKPAKPFVPVPQGTQRRQHQRQLARMKQWKPLTFSQQRQAHRAAQQKAVAHQHHATKVKKASKARKWSPDSEVALCTARAFAESLRLSGCAVSDADLLDVYWATAADADAGASIEATYAAILAGGLGGRFPAASGPRSLILGLALPEPHAVAVDPAGGWWSWGEPFDPLEWPELVIEETWAVQWLQ